MEQLDLRELVRIARRRAWIVILLMLVAGLTAYYRSSQETPVYSASGTMMVNPGVNVDINEYNSLFQTQELAATYSRLVATGPVLDGVRERLSVDDLEASVSASNVDGSEFIQVRVTSEDPDRAVQVVNATIEEFQEFMKARAQDRANDAKSGMTQQIESLRAQRAEIDAELATLQVPENANDPEIQQDIQDLTARREIVNQELSELTFESLTLDANILAASPEIQLVNPASDAGQISPNPRNALMLGLFVGLMLGVGVVALLEFLDNTVKPEQNLQGITGAPVLATVTALNRLVPGGSQVFTLTQPRSSATEAMRLLRTNLEFASASDNVDALTITSPSPGEGKSTIAANIGVVMAQAGKTVILVDADLRRPTLHRIFGVPNDRGLTTLLTHPEEGWDSMTQKVALPGLHLITSGPIPPNPADLVGSRRFAALIEQLKREFDLVVIDSPPMLAASDSLAIARYTDGVVMVCQSHKTRIEAVRHASHSIQQGGIRLLGLVLNRQKGQKGAFYYGEYYGSVPSGSPGD